MGQVVRGEVKAGQAADNVAGFWTLDGDNRPLLGGRGAGNLKIGPLGLQIVFHHCQHPCGTAGGGRQMKAVRCKPPDHAVIHDKAVFAQQDAIAAASDAELGPGIDIEAVEELRRIWTDDFDFSKRRGVKYSSPGADGQTLARHSRMHVLAALWEIAGTFPQGDVFKYRALGFGPAVHRGATDRIEEVAARQASKGSKGHRCEGHAEGGETDGGYGAVEQVGGNGQRIEV